MGEFEQQSGYGPVTATMVARLAETRPWVALVGILGFIATAFMVIAAFGMMIAGAFAPDGEFGIVASVFLAMVYLLFALIYFFISLYLVRYARSIRQLTETGETAHMERALEYQRSFWRIVGIISVIYIVLACIGLLFAFIAGIAAVAAW